MHIFSELADNALSGCMLVVAADRRTWGRFRADQIRTKPNQLAQFWALFYSSAASVLKSKQSNSEYWYRPDWQSGPYVQV